MEELLLELSNRLKKAYIRKSSEQVYDYSRLSGYKHGASIPPNKGHKEARKAFKRLTGIHRALDSMKEETMVLDELSRKTIDSYIKKRSTQAKVQATAAKRLEASAEKKNQKVFAAVRHLLTKEETILETEMRSRDDDSAQPRRIAKNKRYNADPHKDQHVNNPEPRHLDGRTKEYDKAIRGEPHTQRFNWGKRHTESDKRKIASGTHTEVKNKDGSVSTKPTEKHHKDARKRYLARRTPEQKARDERSVAAARANMAGRKLNAGDLVTSDAPNLQELSKGTLVSYIQQAAIDAASASRYSKDEPNMKKKVTKRLRGIAKASQKLEK